MELSSTKIRKLLTFQAIELSGSNFLKRKLLLYFGKWNFLIFQETETPKKYYRGFHLIGRTSKDAKTKIYTSPKML